MSGPETPEKRPIPPEAFEEFQLLAVDCIAEILAAPEADGLTPTADGWMEVQVHHNSRAAHASYGLDIFRTRLYPGGHPGFSITSEGGIVTIRWNPEILLGAPGK